MTYNVIGLMSGSSHDGLDICYAAFTLVSGKKWEYEIRAAICIPYAQELKESLKNAHQLRVPDFLRLNTSYARFCAEEVNKFIDKHDLKHKIFFIASHGHTVWHEPENYVSTQIGDGATIAALTGFTTITNLRNMDIAFGGQGAPIVPIADRLLFSDYDYCLNLGGIANITVNTENPIAFDICPANQILDFFAKKAGFNFDHEGTMAKYGICHKTILEKINNNPYYQRKAPKSLNNSFSETEIIPELKTEEPANALATAVSHIAEQIALAIAPYYEYKEGIKMLITGGGTFNQYLIERIKFSLAQKSFQINCVIPEPNLIQYKEALAMALIGVLRWREEANVLASVTGATQNSIGGAFWMGNS